MSKLEKSSRLKKTIGIFNVEKILKKRINSQNHTEYLVKWEGFSNEENTWEPVEHFYNCKDQITKYEKNKLRKINSLKSKKNLQKVMNEEVIEIDNKNMKKIKKNNLQNMILRRRREKLKKVQFINIEEDNDKKEDENNEKLSETCKKITTRGKKEMKLKKSKIIKKNNNEFLRKTKGNSNFSDNSKGCCKSGDIPSEVIGFYERKNGGFDLNIEWKNRQNGLKPNNSIIPSMELKYYDPFIMINFYEKILKKINKKNN